MQSTIKNKVKERYKSSQLPLAVYREVAAHLRQISEVNTGLDLKPFSGGKEAFDYHASQIESLWLEYPQNLTFQSKQQIQAILDYYGQRYQPWELIDSNQ